MQTLEKIKSIVSHVKYKDWQFVVGKKGDGFLIQVQFMGEDTDGSGKLELQKCRKWFVSQHSCDSEVVRSCFLAIRQAEEHELCERFHYKGHQVYNPHLDMDRMADFICAKPFEVRTEPKKEEPKQNKLERFDLDYLCRDVLSVRLGNILSNNLSDEEKKDIRKFFENHNKLDLFKFRNLGKCSFSEMKSFGEKYGLTFKQ